MAYARKTGPESFIVPGVRTKWELFGVHLRVELESAKMFLFGGGNDRAIREQVMKGAAKSLLRGLVNA